LNPEKKGEDKNSRECPHNWYMQIRLTEAEYEAIERKFRNSGLKSRSEFIRAMIFVSDEKLITPSGLSIVGQVLGKSNLIKKSEPYADGKALSAANQKRRYSPDHCDMLK